MRWSDLIITYLAAAAPFGVSAYLGRASRDAFDFRASLRAAGAALVWPLTLLRHLLDHTLSAARRRAGVQDAVGRHEREVEEAKRALVNSLRQAEDLLAEAVWCEDESSAHGEALDGALSEEERHTLFAAREGFERYAGLTLAADGLSQDARPSPREMELCRLAGRAGDDLVVAGRCVHRRSVTRLLAHRERARGEAVRALVAVGELAGRRLAAGTAGGHNVSCGQRAAQLSETLLQTFSRAVNLLSILGDWREALEVSRLLDAECARLRRLAAREIGDAPPPGAASGGQTCTTQAATTASVNTPSRMSSLAGG